MSVHLDCMGQLPYGMYTYGCMDKNCPVHTCTCTCTYASFTWKIIIKGPGGAIYSDIIGVVMD